MLSEARNSANQANAQHSTGPRTEDGKARSSQNARKHGLTASQMVLHESEREIFDAMLDGYHADLSPANTIECDLVDHVVHASWTMRRIRFIEAAMAKESGLDPFGDHTADRLRRYYRDAERSYYRALRELSQQRKQHEERTEAAEAAEAEPSAAVPIRNEPNPAPPPTPRSAPCPCGSGEKYKRCCGKEAPPVLGAAKSSSV